MLTYRNAMLADLPEIVAIYNSTVAGRMVTADTEPVSVESRVAWFDAHDDPQRPLWIVERDGHIAGWVSFQSFYGRPAYRGTAEISIYLSESVRGAGLGKEILRHAIETAPTLGIKTLLGFIFGHNQPSMKLFLSAGFAIWGTFPGVAELDGVERDLIIVGKRINQ